MLDIERDPAEQGFDAHGYDIVIAANVLHATRDLAETLAHCRRLLAPSGILVALEGTTVQGWLDLTFGLLPGWWRFEDEYRPDHALAPPAVWRRALVDAGYQEISFLDFEAGQMVMLARAPLEVGGGQQAVRLRRGRAIRGPAFVRAGSPRVSGGAGARGGGSPCLERVLRIAAEGRSAPWSGVSGRDKAGRITAFDRRASGGA